MALLFAALFFAVSTTARAITEAPAAITPVPAPSCPLTSAVPSCGVECLMDAAGAAGCSNLFDLQCQCQNAAAIRSIASPCVQNSCGDELGLSLESVASAICTQCV
ncbi:hypothetical protein C8A03DRAFT_16449 [Achaetomium macrosporum]|uniref:CFEM domain-containing protein n=1 Tax=Achaetomium macrosporum TaxID=79813 RepID=A0AAN7HB31_9PEZI|nr:hypothetical protein C8A03DRAFT_16449 [Achaetomium macrosporum]